MACETWTGADFHGAKAVLIHAGRLVVLRRDDIPTISWPGRIDLPGGGRENHEDPLTCALRETSEEVGLVIAPDRVVWSRSYPDPPNATWLIAAMITSEEAASLKLGDEGQACWMMEIDAYLAATDAITRQQERVADVLSTLDDQSWRG